MLGNIKLLLLFPCWSYFGPFPCVICNLFDLMCKVPSRTAQRSWLCSLLLYNYTYLCHIRFLADVTYTLVSPPIKLYLFTQYFVTAQLTPTQYFVTDKPTSTWYFVTAQQTSTQYFVTTRDKDFFAITRKKRIFDK